MTKYMVTFLDKYVEYVNAEYFDLENDNSLVFYAFDENVEEDIVFICDWDKVKFVRKVVD